MRELFSFASQIAFAIHRALINKLPKIVKTFAKSVQSNHKNIVVDFIQQSMNNSITGKVQKF